MEAKVVADKIEEIKKIPSFRSETAIQQIILLVNYNYEIKRIGEINELNQAYALYYIFVLKFECITHETSGGNRYIKPNYHIVVLNPKMEEVNISRNGWYIRDLVTFGEDSGYPSKSKVKFILMDKFGELTEEISLGSVFDPSDILIVRKVAQMLEQLKSYSGYHSIENYLLVKKIEKLEEELKSLKSLT